MHPQADDTAHQPMPPARQALHHRVAKPKGHQLDGQKRQRQDQKGCKDKGRCAGQAIMAEPAGLADRQYPASSRYFLSGLIGIP
jgi:hypothetical protein